MSKFSQDLETYMLKSGLTEKQLAKISGFPRSYIALMKNGHRVSVDIVKLKKLLEALNLSPYEYEELWDAYLMARYGNEFYELSRNMVSFIESFGRISKLSIKSSFNHEIPEVRTIDNRVDLEFFVKAVIEQEALKTDGYIRLIVQEDFSFLFNLLPSICRTNSKMPVEHIVCLEGNDTQSIKEQCYNLKTLGKLLPILLSGDENGYEIYYYYDKISSHFSTSALMPYLIITSTYAINISTNMEYAMISREPESHRLFLRLFDERKKICRKMLCKIPTGTHIFEYYMKKRPDTENVYTIGSQPCFGVFPVDAMVEKYFSGQDGKLMEMILAVLKQNREIYGATQTITSYFTKSGITRLMEQGIIQELPREIYIPLKPEDRKLLLHMLITAIKSDSYKAYLINDEKFAYPEELLMTTYNFAMVDIIYMSNNIETRFILEEQSLARSIYGFLEKLKDGIIVYDSENTLAYLESVYESF